MLATCVWYFASVLNHLTCLFLGFQTVYLFCYCEILLLWRKLGLYKFSLWWHKIYGIYMRISLFGLSSRCINLMNTQSELVQLVLSIFVFNACLMSLRIITCAYAHDTVFNACFLIQICRYMIFTWFRTYYWFSDYYLCYWSLPVLECLNHITLTCTRVTACALQLASFTYLLAHFLIILGLYDQISECEM